MWLYIITESALSTSDTSLQWLTKMLVLVKARQPSYDVHRVQTVHGNDQSESATHDKEVQSRMYGIHVS